MNRLLGKLVVSTTIWSIGAGAARAQGFTQSSPRRIPAPDQTRETEGTGQPEASKNRNRDKCREAFFQYAIPLKKLAQYLKISPPLASEATEVLALDAEDCKTPDRRIHLIKLLTRLLNTHDTKAMLLVPATAPSAPQKGQAGTNADLAVAALERGIAASLGAEGLKSLQTLRIPAATGAQALTEDDIAKAIAIPFWTHKPALLLSALPPSDEFLVSSLARELAIPVINIGPAPADENPKARSARIFRLFPDQKHMAITLAGTTCARGIKKVGILRPSSPESGAFARNFESAFSGCGGVTAQGGIYASANFEAVDIAMKEIVPGLIPGPNATTTRTGLLILDDARIARHVSKLAQINGITSVTLMGHHRWRSPTIVTPWDPAFEGSFFVDYLGLNLSSGNNQTQFPDAQTMWQTIWAETGRRAGQLIKATFDAGSGYPRKNLHRIIAGLPAPQDTFFKSRTFFGPDLSAWWPAFVYTISQGKVQGGQSGTHAEPVARAPAVTAAPAKQ